MTRVRESQVYRHGQLLFTTAPIATPRELTPKDRNTLANELTAIAARLAAAPSLHETFAKAVKIERRAGQQPLPIVAEQQPSKNVPGTAQFDKGLFATI